MGETTTVGSRSETKMETNVSFVILMFVVRTNEKVFRKSRRTHNHGDKTEKGMTSPNKRVKKTLLVTVKIRTPSHPSMNQTVILGLTEMVFNIVTIV